MILTPRPLVIGLAVAGSLALAGLAGCSSDSAGNQASSASGATAATGTPQASGAAATATPMPSGTPVATQDLVALISDRTFTGDFRGEAYSEYYSADGTLRGISKGSPYQGTWALVADELCFSYPADSDAPDCYTAALDGSTVLWYQNGQLAGPTTFVEGNPQNL